MKRIFFKSALFAFTVVSFIGSAHGQQTNIHVSLPPLVDAGMKHNRYMSASYIRMDGERLHVNGMDVNTIFRGPISNTTAWDISVGVALLGSVLGGQMDVDASERDVSGVVLHGSYNREYVALKNPSSSLMLFMGIPVSFGNFILENREDVTVYNLMAGLQGGARLDLRMGDFIGAPLFMAHFMGGYTERYDGGVYLENLDSGGVPVFAVITAGLDIIYLPLGLKLSGMYQRTFESGDNEPIDATLIQFGFSF
ncbi:MAG: hypothetical protein P8Y75_12085 [Nitrospirota bacterium]|jgi:hypothetical protein